MKGLYLILDIITIVGPLAMAFEKKIQFYRLIPRYLIGILAVFTLFIPWDIYFTINGVWGFNPDYLIGIEILHLPLEEWLFFLAVPLASAFIHENVKLFIKHSTKWDARLRNVFKALTVILVALAMLYDWNWYTFITFSLSALFLIYHLWIKKSTWFFHFAISYGIVLIPFLIVNGVLTGGFTEAPIVWYDSNHIIGLRIGSIPVEDSIYNLLMMGLMVWIFESLSERNKS